VGAIVRNPVIDIDGIEYEMEIANIEGTHLGFEDHGIFTAFLHLGGPSWGQAIGGLAFDAPEPESSPRYKFGTHRRGRSAGMDMIIRICETVGVDRWEHVYRKKVYALRGDPLGRIVGIANLDAPERKYLILEDAYFEYLDLIGEN